MLKLHCFLPRPQWHWKAVLVWCLSPRIIAGISLHLAFLEYLCCLQRHLHHCGLDEGPPGWRSRLSRSRINSAVYIAHSPAERDPLVPSDCAGSLRRAKSAGNLRDQEFERQDSEFQRQDSEFDRQDSETSGQIHFELPILSISMASDKPFVEQHL